MFISTFDHIATNCLDCYYLQCFLVDTFIDLSELTIPNFLLQYVLINHFGHTHFIIASNNTFDLYIASNNTFDLQNIITLCSSLYSHSQSLPIRPVLPGSIIKLHSIYVLYAQMAVWLAVIRIYAINARPVSYKSYRLCLVTNFGAVPILSS